MEYRHDSQGMLSFSKTQGGSRNLFGSSISPSETVRLSIKQAISERSNNTDRFYPINGEKGDLIQVEMSLSQFAQAISSMNTGGVLSSDLKM